MIIKAFLLDLDGVISETSEFHYLAWKTLAAELGVEIDREFNEQLKGVARMESLERILAHGGKSDAYAQAEKDEYAARKNAHYVELLKDVTPDDVLPGIPEFMASIKEAGMAIAIASISKNAPAIIQALNLGDMVDYIADAAAVARSKPFPDIFLDAARGVHCAPENCLGVEDAEVGITAIHAAGMKAVAVGDKRFLGEADYIVPNTASLRFADVMAFFADK